MEQMKTDNPEVVSTQVYGKSYENRDITLLKVRKKKKKSWAGLHLMNEECWNTCVWLEELEFSLCLKQIA